MLGSVIAIMPEARYENYERQRNARGVRGRKGDLSPTVFFVPRDYDSAIVRKSRHDTSGERDERRGLLIVINSRSRGRNYSSLIGDSMYGEAQRNARY